MYSLLYVEHYYFLLLVKSQAKYKLTYEQQYIPLLFVKIQATCKVYLEGHQFFLLVRNQASCSSTVKSINFTCYL